MQNNQNFEKALIKIMYNRGEINEATYEKIMQKLKKEAIKNERKK